VTPVRVRARVEGTVQGVGFRPYVYGLARQLGLGGYVLNDERGVLLEVEADADAVQRFLERLAAEAPPLASVERVRTEPAEPTGETVFAIRASPRGREPRAAVTADSATCERCLAELRDPADRRFRYPFINCTDCGPRFTIVRDVPYDRPFTTMAGFAMCDACRAEYEDPGDRRFHAQPNACPACGPAVRLLGGGMGDAAVAAAAGALRGGAIVAVKGIGGYHQASRADDETAVAALRTRKHREEKPFAVMAAGIDDARALVRAGAADEALLVSHRRPIVLAPRQPDAAVAAAVAPGAPDLGVMLAYSPLHHLLVAGAGGSLVMTSGNRSDEPIAYRDADAVARLAGIADLVLAHDRPIETRTDDSVVRTVALGGARRPLLLRRSRGFVPDAIALPVGGTGHVLAVGAELKSTFCVAKGDRAWVSHHIGDLRNDETLVSFTEGIAHFERLFAVRPAAVAHDLHPDYLSTAYALERDGVEHVAVQHHHAHLAACLAEHGETGPAIGAIFDGTGYGTDGTIWGGELLYGDLQGFERLGHLWPVRLPGGDAAVRAPWRMARAWLDAALGGEPAVPAALARDVDETAWRQVGSLVRSGFAAPATTSAGRLCDAVAALCGVRPVVSYEGQAAIELEALCDPAERGAHPLPALERDGMLVLDARETVQAVVDDLAAGASPPVVAARFHTGVAAGTAAACAALAEAHGGLPVVLSGGVFQNRRLLEGTAAALVARGLRVLVPERLPPNDGGIAYGQAAVAAARAAAA
jgi:hydrogenase maturation protein HypF